MKNINLIFAILFFATTNNVNAKFSMNSLNRVRNKVEAALSKPSQTKETINKILNKKSSDEDSDRKSLASIITTIGNSVVEGLDLCQYNIESLIEKLDNFIENMIWGNQFELVKELNEKYKTSKEEARNILINKIKQQYPESKKPLLQLVSDLNKEIITLQEITCGADEIAKKRHNLNNNSTTKIQLLEPIYQKLNLIESTLETLGNILLN